MSEAKPTLDEAFDDLAAEHKYLAGQEVIDTMYLLRNFLRDHFEVTGNGFGMGEADVSFKLNGRHIWVIIKDKTPEAVQ